VPAVRRPPPGRPPGAPPPPPPTEASLPPSRRASSPPADGRGLLPPFRGHPARGPCRPCRRSRPEAPRPARGGRRPCGPDAATGRPVRPGRRGRPPDRPVSTPPTRRAGPPGATIWGPSPIREETYGSVLGAMLTPVNRSFLAIGSRVDGAVPLLLMGRAVPPSRRRRGDRPPGRRVFRRIRGECRRGENPASETDGPGAFPGAFSLCCGRRAR
jgi:hypothetical protein